MAQIGAALLDSHVTAQEPTVERALRAGAVDLVLKAPESVAYLDRGRRILSVLRQFGTGVSNLNAYRDGRRVLRTIFRERPGREVGTLRL